MPGSATRHELDGIALRRESVPAPEIGPGKFIIVQQPRGDESDELRIADWPEGGDGMLHLQRKGRDSRWVMACAVDHKGERLYGAGDLDAVNKLPGSLRRRIADAARTLDADAGTATNAAIEAEAKNSAAGQDSSSLTA